MYKQMYFGQISQDWARFEEISALESALLGSLNRVQMKETYLLPSEAGPICAAGCYAACPNKNGDQTALSLAGAAAAHLAALGN